MAKVQNAEEILADRLKRIESNRCLRCFVKLDSYGDSAQVDPTTRDKSVCGGLISVTLKLIVFTLILMNTVYLFMPDRVIVTGDPAFINYYPKKFIQRNGDLDNLVLNFSELDTSGQMDFPALRFDINHTLTFYSTEAPVIQRVDFSDNSRLLKPARSSATKPSITKAFYGSVEVPLNSFDSVTAVVASPTLEVYKELDDSLAQSREHKFPDSRNAILANMAQTVDEFVDHSAHLYVRLPEPELRPLLQCQMQIQLMNKGETDALRFVSQDFDDLSYLDQFTTLTTSDSTWKTPLVNPSDQEVVNLFQLHRTVDTAWKDDVQFNFPQAGVSDASFYDWRWAFGYVNNFHQFLPQYTCRSADVFRLHAMPASPPAVADRFVRLSPNTTIDTMRWSEFVPPFNIAVTGARNTVELMTVTSYNETVIIVDRPTPREFDLLAQLSNEYEKVYNDTLTQGDDPPDTWLCPAAYYNVLDGCDCGCGALDPDCRYQEGVSTGMAGEPQELYGCSNVQVCGFDGKCASASDLVEESEVVVSSPCRTEILPPNSEVILGAVGTPADNTVMFSTCPVCPGDDLFQEKAAFLNDQPMCYMTPEAQIIAYDEFDGGAKANMTVSLSADQSFLGFPQPLAGEPLKIKVPVGAPRQSEIPILVTGEKTPFNTMKLTTEAASDLGLFASGKIYSAVYPDVHSVVVSEMGDNPFPADQVPFTVQVIRVGDSFLLNVTGVITVQNDLQVLFLGNRPSGFGGTIWEVIEDAAIGDTAVKVRPVYSPRGAYFPSYINNGSAPFVVTMRDSVVTSTIDYYQVVQEDVPWPEAGTLMAESYGARDDICDCGVGLGYDPDCAIPSPGAFSGATRRWYDQGTTGFAKYAPDLTGACEVNVTTGYTECRDLYCDLDGTPVVLTADYSPIPIAPGVFPDAYPFRLNFAQALRRTLSAGAGIESGIETDEGSSRAELMTVTSTFKARLVRDDEKDMFPAAVRNPSQAPSLHAEMAMFTVPKMVPYTSLNLCPDSQFASTSAPEGYVLNDLTSSQDYYLNCADGFEEVVCDGADDDPISLASIAPDFVYKDCEIAQMPATNKFKFQYRMPINHKWDSYKISATNDPSAPEFVTDVATRFFFPYDADAEEVERTFAKNRPPTGDLVFEDNAYSSPSFTGALHFKGTGAASDDIPANPPKLSLDIKLVPDLELTNAMLGLNPKYWPNEIDADWFDGKWDDLRIYFDATGVGGVDNEFFLHPGKRYIFRVYIALTPIYSKNKLGITSIDRWGRSVTSSRVDVVELSYFDRQVVEIEFDFRINPEMTQLVDAVSYTLNDYVSALGSSIAWLALGVMMLKVWYRLSEEKTRAAIEPEYYQEYELMDV